MKPKFGVVVFPGSNCDHDAYYVAKKTLDCDTEFLWHKDKDLKGSDIIILPGGFSYGDHLRSGAIARFSPIMEEVIKFAGKGGTVVGICNGFQVLVESGLLPGVLMKNESLKFKGKDVYLKIEHKNSKFTSAFGKDIIKVPVAHGDGNYFADEKTLDELEANNQVLFRYTTANGGGNGNPNGSQRDIAGIMNKEGNVMGMMPHPERCSHSILGNTDGIGLFESLLENMKN